MTPTVSETRDLIAHVRGRATAGIPRQIMDQLANATEVLLDEHEFRDDLRGVVTCVYCGHEYPPGTPRSQHELLTEHIKVCEKHPLTALRRRITGLIEIGPPYYSSDLLEILNA